MELTIHPLKRDEKAWAVDTALVEAANACGERVIPAQKEGKVMYKKFTVELKFRNKVFGGLPKNPKNLESYLVAKFTDDDPIKEEAQTDLDLDEALEQTQVGFKTDETGLYLGGYQIKAMLAQTASLLELTTKKRGSKQTLKEGLVVRGLLDADTQTGDKVYLLPLRSEATGIDIMAGTVSSPQGKRSIVSRSEYVEEASIRFQLWFLENRMVESPGGKKL